MKVSISWSSGKDAALALYSIKQEGLLEVVSLHTNISKEMGRVGMHGTPLALVEAQAQAIGLPLEIVQVAANSTNQSYEEAMLHYYSQLREQGLEGIVFGDIFLEDLRTYREQLVAKAGLQAYFPLWQWPTAHLAEQLVALNFKAVVCAADDRYFSADAAGSNYDRQFLAHLPEDCDPCGENGEFHTFVADGPYFKKPIAYSCGERLHKTYPLSRGSSKAAGMWFMELLPAH